MDKQPAVLIFSYWFPPSNVIGASRPFAIAQFFREKGWRVIVVCARSEAAGLDYKVDLEGLDVISVSDSRLTAFLNFKVGRRLLMRLLSSLLRLMIYPDAVRPTVTKMYAVARDRIREGQKIDVLISTALPFSLHPAAARLAHEFNVPLILDNRDTWASNPYRRRLPFFERIDRELEHRVFSSADLITSISESMSEIYKSVYPEISEKFHFVRNGTDKHNLHVQSDFSRPKEPLTIVYTGILYGNKRDLRPALRAISSSSMKCIVKFFGSEPDQVAAYASEMPLLDIRDCGRISRDESLTAQRDADFLLLGLGTDILENTFLPGKLFEYISSGRPIVALVNPESEVAKIVNQYCLGIATRSEAEIREFIRACVAGNWVRPNLDLHELSREFQLEKLYGLVRGVLADRER
jgi:glycosyltransferase involved in cell wall biosynthesis